MLTHTCSRGGVRKAWATLVCKTSIAAQTSRRPLGDRLLSWTMANAGMTCILLGPFKDAVRKKVRGG